MHTNHQRFDRVLTRTPAPLKRMRDLAALRTHPAAELLRINERKKYNEEYYNNHYWREDLPGQVGNQGLSYDDPNHNLRFGFLYESLVCPFSPKRMLDVGCGPGLLLERALASGVDAWGVDWSPVAQNLFSRRAPWRWRNRLKCASITNIPFLTHHCDLCICIDVLEHVPVFDIFHAIAELCRVCSRTIVCSINLDNP